jgi:hypothetical protein
MTEEDQEAQTEFVREYIADWDPKGAIDVQMASTLVRPYPLNLFAQTEYGGRRIKAVEENVFAWGHEVDNSDCCHSDIPQIENALTHAVSYMQYADRIDKISLYESRLSRIIARNIDILNKRQADRRDRVKQPDAAPITEPLTQTVGASAQQTQSLNVPIGFALSDRSDPLVARAIPVEALDDVPIAA